MSIVLLSAWKGAFTSTPATRPVAGTPEKKKSLVGSVSLDSNGRSALESPIAIAQKQRFVDKEHNTA
jgi:hypothetical protein